MSVKSENVATLRPEAQELQNRLERFIKTQVVNPSTDKKITTSSMQQVLLTVLPPLHKQVCEDLVRLVKDCSGVDPQFRETFKPSDFDVDETVFAELMLEIGGLDSFNTTSAGFTAILDKLHFTEALTDELEKYKQSTELFGLHDKLVTFDSYYHSIDDVLEDVQRTWVLIEKLVERQQLPEKRGLAAMANKLRRSVMGIARHASKGADKVVMSPPPGTPITPSHQPLGWATLDPFLSAEVTTTIRDWKEGVESGSVVDRVARFKRAMEAIDEWEADGKPKRKREEERTLDEPAQKRRGRGRPKLRGQSHSQTATPEPETPARRQSPPPKSPTPVPKSPPKSPPPVTKTPAPVPKSPAAANPTRESKRRVEKPAQVKQEPVESQPKFDHDPIQLPAGSMTTRQLVLQALCSTQSTKSALKRSLLPHVPELIKQAKLVQVTGSNRMQASDAADDLHSGLSSGRGVVEFEIGADVLGEDVWRAMFQLLGRSPRSFVSPPASSPQ